ncbi:lysosomal alpha-glucosidase-like isoform X2 [Ischnura elegans]|uniref:lysosomal alpha-glucosidase-like isoform X2 n=1 Tax=Ischnura elegans TaxID=197161 RepID=UPI001ED870F5|nr:lysosomal alpha-glucosidase-like isoform X2 [Ischnura elegans]
MLDGIKHILRSIRVFRRSKAGNPNQAFGEALQQHIASSAELNQHSFSHQKPTYEHFVGEEDDDDYEEDFGVVDCECDDENKRKCGRKDCPRPNIATILVCVLLFLVFVLLPAVYLLHCFDLLKSHWEVNEDGNGDGPSGYSAWEYAMVDHTYGDSVIGDFASSAKGKGALKKRLREIVITERPPVLETSAPTRSPTPPPHSQCSALPEARRFDCFPGEGASKEGCEARGCCWVPTVQEVRRDYNYGSKVEVNSEGQGNKEPNNLSNSVDSHNEGGKMKNVADRKAAEGEGLPPLNVPYCYFPPGDTGHYYSWVNISSEVVPSYRDLELDPLEDERSLMETGLGSMTGFLKLHTPSPYPSDIPLLRVDVKFETKERLRVKITDASHPRYEPPYPEVPILDISRKDRNTVQPQDSLYRVEMDKSRVGFAVIRRSNNRTLFDSRSVGALVYADQFLQMSALLPSDSSMYGIGEHQAPLNLPVNWQRFVLFNHDSVPKNNTNLYGSHPFYMATEKDGSSHGVFLLNSNAMEVILQPGPAVTFRAIGGVIDLHFFLGPSPREVVAQYTDLVGRPFMPPLWGLGFHLCRFGYKTLNRTREVCESVRKAGIPLDVQWNDLDYMKQGNDFTYDPETFKGLPEFVEELHKLGMHYVPLIDAGISGGDKAGTYPPYDEGLAAGVFIKNSSGLPFVGKVWNKVSTVWPDFTNPTSVPYWSTQMERLHKQVAFDGAWIDMNEPSNFYSGTEKGCPTSGTEPGPYGRREADLEHPPYLPPVEGSLLAFKTVCMSARHFAGSHYDVHNLHGFTHAIVTSFAMTELRGRRPFVISRSTFAGHGHYAGHWSGDEASTWTDMANTVPAILNFNIFGVPLVGADICGFNGNTTVELCSRWSQLGAFYPFSRNHNTDDGIDQDPVSLGPLVVQSARKALLIRYSLLPYLYTLFWRAHAFGDTVARPLFFEFPDDPNTHGIDRQFLWGSGFMIVPVLDEGKTAVDAYIPKGIWYDFYSKEVISSSETGHMVTLPAPADTIPLLVRGGTIIPMQAPNMTTGQTRQNKIELMVAVDNDTTASGVLYWDDDDSLNTWEEGHYSFLTFTLGKGNTTPGRRPDSNAELAAKQVTGTAEGSVLSGVVTWRGVPVPVNLGAVRVMGVSGPVRGVSANGQSVPFSYDTKSKYLVVENLDLDLNTVFIIMWY